MIVPELPYPVNPRLVGRPNLEVSPTAGYLAMGTSTRQEILSKWVVDFPPVISGSELELPSVQREKFFLVQLVANTESVAIYIDSDLVGFVGKVPRQKFIESVKWLKEHRYPAVCQAFFVGDSGHKFGLRLYSNGMVLPKLLKGDDTVLAPANYTSSITYTALAPAIYTSSTTFPPNFNTLWSA